MEFSKKLLIVDYAIMIALIILAIIFSNIEMTVVASAWIAQIGVTSGCYLSKSKAENCMRIPYGVIKDIPEEIRDEVDLTQIITEIIRNT